MDVHSQIAQELARGYLRGHIERLPGGYSRPGLSHTAGVRAVETVRSWQTQTVGMRVLVTTPAGLGHIHPMVPLAQAVAKAGHEVRWALPAGG